ncbi:DEAD/DEAH box helicase [Clostridium beijerinckii]|uniref:UvrABC system protein B n=1 Tax=Clostridium beijerinckii TaxID=1520 RepID=A0A1S8S7M2_CLOBE|nr:DEAD/DEAH box helicase family protein [Clostridium beijerinckii]NRY61478.1 superfamily II DNA or RNA helicase [Clostridium beijerinckii]OOM61265.1 UvrABC system protein B [Clostridium beijerinckii]
MHIIEIKIGKNKIFQMLPKSKSKVINYKLVKKSWTESFTYKQENETNKIKGLRIPQLGALFAIKAHWSTSRESATIVMPTGTGKTETMISAIISESCDKTLIIVPSNLLRKQVTEKCISLGILKEVDVIKSKAINPVVAMLSTTPSSADELRDIVDKSNIIVTTMSLINVFPSDYIEICCELCSELFIDEAHHIAASTWNQLKRQFEKQRILQFTATPFRNDEKKVDGKIIYNFPLALAQEQGYFENINFKSIFEFDEECSDLSIAKAAVEQLETDIDSGYNHIILVRANTKQRSEKLFRDIYLKHFNRYNPVLVNSNLNAKQRKEAMESIEKQEARIVVCVDMFGEGIDIPNLKIAAIHDKYKSLPITLQFIGRFARKKAGLGNATIVANIADDDIKEGLRELYSQDSDWNVLLKSMSSFAIDKEVSLQELADGFSKLGLKNLDIKQLMPKVSMMAFKTDDQHWRWQNWTKAFDEDICRCCVHEERKVLVIIEPQESKVEWVVNKEISDVNWQLHILYWNSEKKMVFINSTDKTKCNRLVEAVFDNFKKVQGETVFKCLHGIKRLMFGTVGLNSAINGPIRYKMYAGIDIAQGLTESQKRNCVKSNLFGNGYNGKGRVSIGCSYKGTIWSRWVESIEFWTRWCNDIADKINNPNINVDEILKGALSPKMILTRPNVVPYSIEWPIELTVCNEERIKVITNFNQFAIYDVEIGLLNNDEEKPIQFYIGNSDFKEEYELVFDEKNETAYYKCISHANAKIKMGKSELSLTDFFDEYPPQIRFVDQSTLETNLYVELKTKNSIELDGENIEVWDWKGIDITKESQGYLKEQDSVQYKVISTLKDKDKYEIIFDDDNAGEIADVITIEEYENKICFEFYHCKFSHGEKPGSRVGDLYEVCGQAEKSVVWKQNGKKIIDRMIKRETDRLKKGLPSRIEMGSLRRLKEIKNKLSVYDYDIKINIVQPGVDAKKISDAMNELLCGTKAYLMDTFSLQFKMICS